MYSYIIGDNWDNDRLFPTIFELPTFSGLSTTDETLVVEMRIWCIKIGNVFALRFTVTVQNIHLNRLM